MWKVQNKDVDLGEPTSFLDHVYLGCTQRQCEISKDILNNYRTMFESRISAGATEKLPCSENMRISSWSYDMEGHAKKCVERYCELANRTTQQLYKVSTQCIDDHHFKEEEIEIRGRIVKSMLSDCPKMLLLGTYWKTRHSVVSQLETSVVPAMPCKIMKNCGSSGSDKIQTKLVCILEADESTRMRMGNSIPHNHEDHIAGKGENSLQHYNLVHKFIPMPQAMKIPAAKVAVDKEWEKLEKISAWNLTKVKSKKKVIDEARTAGATVHFASLMDICHLKNAELETKHQKYKGRVVLRGNIVKDDSGSYAVFTEQGSSASQMTAAKIMDIISRLPGCDGQAADAVSAYTQVKMEDAPKLLKIPKSECPDIWIRLPRHKWPESWSSMEDPAVPLERNLYGHPLAGLLWERQFENILLKHDWENIPNWECLFVHHQKGLFLSVCG